MSQVTSGVSSGGGAANSAASNAGGFGNVNMDEFLKLLIAQMQNQDPLSPMENTEIMQQISQIREIGATDKLTSTLDSVLMGQNLSTASGLIGKRVSALTDDGRNVTGVVDRVSVETDSQGENRQLRVLIEDQKIELRNIREVVG